MKTLENKSAEKEWIGRDELNICEFPIALLTERVPLGMNNIQFKDTIFDQAENRFVDRKLTISGSAIYGLTTSSDVDVLMSLIYHTYEINCFKEKRVPFTRYELIKIMQWNDEGHNYKRLTESMRRWAHINLDYANSWRDKNRKIWSSKTVHILDEVHFLVKAGRRSKNEKTEDSCWYIWGETIFESLQSGNLKKIDLKKYFALKSSIAKFMFRYLDKKFYNQDVLEFDVDIFAHEKIGLSRNYKPSQIKFKLEPAIKELVSIGFIMHDDHRYSQTDSKWKIRFTSVKHKPLVSLTPKQPPPLPDSAKKLISQGVSEAKALEIALNYTESDINDQINAMLWKNNKPGTVEDPAAYLVKAIENKWSLPQGYLNSLNKQEVKVNFNIQLDEEQRKRHEEREINEKINNFWNSLSEQQQEIYYEKAIDDLPEEERREINELKTTNPMIYRLRRSGARVVFIRKELKLPPI